MTDNVDISNIAKLSSTVSFGQTFFDRSGSKMRSEDSAEWSMTHAGTFLIEKNGTISWDGDSDQFGYNNVWEFCAGEHFGKNCKPKTKAELAELHFMTMKNGYRNLQKRLEEEWGMNLIMTPRRENGKYIEVITLDPTFVVNSAGQTAGDLYMNRGFKMTIGQLSHLYRRTALHIGEGNANNLISDKVNFLLSQPLPSPKMNQITSEV